MTDGVPEPKETSTSNIQSFSSNKLDIRSDASKTNNSAEFIEALGKFKR